MIGINESIDILSFSIVKIVIVILDSNSIGRYKSGGRNDFCRQKKFLIVIVIIMLSLQKDFICHKILIDCSIGLFYFVKSSQLFGSILL